jgi:hypothetical protein
MAVDEGGGEGHDGGGSGSERLSDPDGIRADGGGDGSGVVRRFACCSRNLHRVQHRSDNEKNTPIPTFSASSSMKRSFRNRSQSLRHVRRRNPLQR